MGNNMLIKPELSPQQSDSNEPLVYTVNVYVDPTIAVPDLPTQSGLCGVNYAYTPVYGTCGFVEVCIDEDTIYIAKTKDGSTVWMMDYTNEQFGGFTLTLIRGDLEVAKRLQQAESDHFEMRTQYKDMKTFESTLLKTGVMRC